MAKKTIKITFDDADPVYGFLAWYGARFGARVGLSVAARVMIDHAYDSRDTFTPSMAQPTTVTLPSVENTANGLHNPTKITKTESGKHADLLSAIQEFQDHL